MNSIKAFIPDACPILDKISPRREEGRSSLHALLKPGSCIYAPSRAEEPEKLAKFAPSSETWARLRQVAEEDLHLHIALELQVFYGGDPLAIVESACQKARQLANNHGPNRSC
jgi:hypothetical protein